MFTLASYLHWQIQAQDNALNISRKSEHVQVRADVPKIARELACLRAVANGIETPYRAYCEAMVAINCQARTICRSGNFWELLREERRAARQHMKQAMRWRD
jgi:hypothetical protein